VKWYKKVRDTSAGCMHPGQGGGGVTKVDERGRRRREAVQASNLARMPRVACCGHMGFRSALSHFVVASDIVRVACCGHMGFRSALSNFVVASDIVPRV